MCCVFFTVVAPPVIPLFSIRVFCVDSVFRSNRSDRVALLAQLEAQRPKKQLTAAAARSKQAQKKREEVRVLSFGFVCVVRISAVVWCGSF